MSEVKAYDMSEHWRLIGVDSHRVSGHFWVTEASERGVIWVKPVEVSIWDESRSSGRVFYSGDFAATVEDGVVSLPERMIVDSKCDDARDAWDELLEAIAAVAALAPGGDH